MTAIITGLPKLSATSAGTSLPCCPADASQPDAASARSFADMLLTSELREDVSAYLDELPLEVVEQPDTGEEWFNGAALLAVSMPQASSSPQVAPTADTGEAPPQEAAGLPTTELQPPHTTIAVQGDSPLRVQVAPLALEQLATTPSEPAVPRHSAPATDRESTEEKFALAQRSSEDAGDNQEVALPGVAEPVRSKAELGKPAALSQQIVDAAPAGDFTPLQLVTSQTAPMAGTAASATLSTTPMLQDLGFMIDRLIEAREAGRVGEARLALTHKDFGPVGVRFETASNTSLAASISSADPEFAPAVQAALAERWQAERVALERAPGVITFDRQDGAGTRSGDGLLQNGRNSSDAGASDPQRRSSSDHQPNGRERSGLDAPSHREALVSAAQSQGLYA